MLRPITSKAEISIDFPDKTYIGSFAEHSRFGVDTDDEGVTLRLVHSGEGHSVAELRLHYSLLADILAEAATGLAARPLLDDLHRAALRDAARALERATSARRPASRLK